MKRKGNFFAEQLRKILFEKKLTQEELGNLIGVKRPMISQWVTGARNPSLSSIKRIAEALKVPVKYFVDDENIKKEIKSYENNDVVKLMMSLITEHNKAVEEKMKRFELELNLIKKELSKIKK